MKPAGILSEAWRDISSGANRTMLWPVALLTTAGCTLGMEMGMIISLEQEATTWTTSGAAINLVQSQGRISPTGCISLSRTTGTPRRRGTRTEPHTIAGNHPISSSGALKAGPTITLRSMPQSPWTASKQPPAWPGSCVYRLPPKPGLVSGSPASCPRPCTQDQATFWKRIRAPCP